MRAARFGLARLPKDPCPDVFSFARRRAPSDPPSPWVLAASHDPLPIGGVAVGLILGTYALLGLPVSAPLLVGAFCGAALVYGVDRVVVTSPEDRRNRPDRVAWVRDHRPWLAFEGAILVVIGSGALFYLRPLTVLGGGGLGAIALLHQWLPGRGGLGKPLLVAGVWAVASTALPAVEAGAVRAGPLGGLVAYRMLFLLPNVLLSDWGDRAGDRAAGLQPWAAGTERRTVQGAATVLLLAALAVGALGFVGSVPPMLLAVEAAGIGGVLTAVWTLRPEKSAHRLVLDLLVAWPAVTAGAAWGIS